MLAKALLGSSCGRFGRLAVGKDGGLVRADVVGPFGLIVGAGGGACVSMVSGEGTTASGTGPAGVPVSSTCCSARWDSSGCDRVVGGSLLVVSVPLFLQWWGCGSGTNRNALFDS